RADPPVDQLVGIAKQAPAFGVSEDHELRARLLHHLGADLTSERPLPFPMRVLRRDADVGVARRLGHRVHGGEGRRNDDLHVGDVLHHAAELFDEHDRLVHGLVHLPVGADEWDSHGCVLAGLRRHFLMLAGPHPRELSLGGAARGATLRRLARAAGAQPSATTPGSWRPPRHSSDAPPPVEMCLMRSVTPALATAAIESPPPITVVPATDATALATSMVPVANTSISNTPIGPFQTTVLAPCV